MRRRVANRGPSARADRVLAGLAAILLAGAGLGLAGCGGQESASSAAAADVAAVAPKLYAPGVIEPTRMAPEIALHNYTGTPVRLSQFRGKAVLLTFIYDHCPDTCPLIVEKLHDALGLLGANAHDAQVIAVSVDPVGDTPQSVSQFLALHQMTGRMDYLIGTQKELAPIWKTYGIAVTGTPESREAPGRRVVSHTALVYGITGKGQWLALYSGLFKPTEIAHDVPLLAAS